MLTLSASASNSTHQALALTANQLSSGKRITSAAVDPAGLAAANALLTQAAGFTAGASNAQSAIDASNVAQGALVTISDAARSLNTLAVAANNDLLSASDRAALQTQAGQTTQAINGIAGSTQYNGVSLLAGSTPTDAVQTGANEGSTGALSLPSSGTGALGLSNVDLSSSSSASSFEHATDAATAAIGSSQATLGSQTVALGIDQQNSRTASVNLTAAASNIADTDVAKTATKAAAAQTQAQLQIALQIQAGLAASSVLGYFAHSR
jgi:flagellin